MVYRFKITYEDHEDVFRYIEIKSSQSFFELHKAIQQAIEFDNSKSAVFYMSDDYWRKGEEISIENKEEGKIKKNNIKKYLGKAGKEEPEKEKTIANNIDNPHQRFVYISDPEKEWTFLLELLKIVPEDKTASYPQCVKSVGASPKQYKPTQLPPPVEEEEEAPKNLSSKKIEKEEHDPIVLEKDPLEEEAEGFIPLNAEGVEEIADDEIITELDENEEELNADEDIAEIDPEGNESLD